MDSECWNIPEPTALFKVHVSDGVETVVRRHGNPDGPRLLLSHGSGLAVDAYYPFWSQFADRFDLFVHDIRNHGWNPVGERRRHNVPTFIDDTGDILRHVGQRFGEKQVIGLFHSLSALTALHHAAGSGGFSALVLFDPPICPPGGFPTDLQGVGRRLGAIARRRRDRFESPEDFVNHLARSPVFERMSPAALNLFARTTLRRAVDSAGWELCCPREYEAQISEYIFCWAMTVDLESVPCPVKAIGADPTIPYSYMPGTELADIRRVDYDFLPETTHLLQLEQPEQCAALALEFLEDQGFA